jgi:hypothetical protein
MFRLHVSQKRTKSVQLWNIIEVLDIVVCPRTCFVFNQPEIKFKAENKRNTSLLVKLVRASVRAWHGLSDGRVHVLCARFPRTVNVCRLERRLWFRPLNYCPTHGWEHTLYFRPFVLFGHHVSRPFKLKAFSNWFFLMLRCLETLTYLLMSN